MCPFPTLPPQKQKYELDAAHQCPFYIAARIRVKIGEDCPEALLRIPVWEKIRENFGLGRGKQTSYQSS
jgi:hypothetical protein